MPARGRPGWAGASTHGRPAPSGPVSDGLRHPGEWPACLLRTGGCSLCIASHTCARLRPKSRALRQAHASVWRPLPAQAWGAASARSLDQAAPLRRLPGAGRACDQRAGLRRGAPVTAPKLTKRADVARNTRRAQPLSARSWPRNAVANGADVSMSAAGTCPRAQRLVGASMEALAKPTTLGQKHAVVAALKSRAVRGLGGGQRSRARAPSGRA